LAGAAAMSLVGAGAKTLATGTSAADLVTTALNPFKASAVLLWKHKNVIRIIAQLF
jgi:hypothetical protein